MTFYELEKECKKRRILFIILIVLIITALILSAIYLYLKFFKTYNVKTVEVKKIKIKTTPQNNIKEIKPLKRIILPNIDLNDVNITDKEIKKAKKIKEVKKSKQEPKNLLIKSQNLPSFQTCINLAKKYFEQKNYTQALKWSKNANIQNSKDPASWIITAKSLNALGKKEKALKILKIYNNFYHNKDVKKVIKEIEK